MDTFAGTVTIVRDIVVICVSIFSAGIAYKGLGTWKRQLTGNVEYELGRRLVRAVLKVRDGLHAVRDEVIMHSEIEGAAKEGDASTAAIYDIRWSRVADARADLKVESLEAEFHWGDESIEKLKPLDDCVRKLRRAWRRHLRHPRREKPLEKSEMEEIDSIIYGTNDPTDDEFAKEIQTAIEGIQEFVKTKLKDHAS